MKRTSEYSNKAEQYAQREKALNFLQKCLSEQKSGDNGEGMQVTVLSDRIIVKDTNNDDYDFLAVKNSDDGMNVLGLAIYSRVDGVNSPWIWSKEFVKVVFEYFGGYSEIDAIRGSWDNESDNFKSLVDSLGSDFDLETIDSDENIHSEKIKKALMDTWTGQLAQGLEYNNPVVQKRYIPDVPITDQSIDVFFKK